MEQSRLFLFPASWTEEARANAATTHLRRLRANTAGGGGGSAAAATGSVVAASASPPVLASVEAAAAPPEARLAPAALLAGLKKARMEPPAGCMEAITDASLYGGEGLANDELAWPPLPQLPAATSCRMGHLICAPAVCPGAVCQFMLARLPACLRRCPLPPPLPRKPFLSSGVMTVAAAQQSAEGEPAAKMQRTEPPAETLRVRRLNEHALLPKRGSSGAAGYDLAA